MTALSEIGPEGDGSDELRRVQTRRVDLRDRVCAKSGVPQRYVANVPVEETPGEHLALADRELVRFPDASAAGIVLSQLAVPIDGARSGARIERRDDEMPLAFERCERRRVGNVRPCGRVESQRVVRLELEIEIVTVLRIPAT